MSATVASVAAELDCEGERADQVAGYLREQDNKRTQRLNVFSISTEAAGGLGTTAIENKPGQYAFGIGGGLLAAGRGLLTLTGNHTAAGAGLFKGDKRIELHGLHPTSVR